MAARRAAAEHQDQHGRLINRDALRARLGVSNQAASDLLRQSAPARTARRELPGPPDLLPRGQREVGGFGTGFNARRETFRQPARPGSPPLRHR